MFLATNCVCIDLVIFAFEIDSKSSYQFETLLVYLIHVPLRETTNWELVGTQQLLNIIYQTKNTMRFY